MLCLLGCANEDTPGRPPAPPSERDWVLISPSLFATNVSQDSPIKIKYDPKNIRNKLGYDVPDALKDIVPRLELKRMSDGSLYDLDAKIADNCEIDVETSALKMGTHILYLDSFTRQETIDYPISIGGQDAPVLINIRTSSSTSPEKSSVEVVLLLSEELKFPMSALSVTPGSYQEFTRAFNENSATNNQSIIFYYKPGEDPVGQTITLTLNTDQIKSPVSQMSLVPIDQSGFDLSSRHLYTSNPLVQTGDKLTITITIPSSGGSQMTWGVDESIAGWKVRNPQPLL